MKCKFCNKREIRYDENFCSLECKQQWELFQIPSEWMKIEEKKEEDV